MKKKKCRACGESKPLSAFRTHKGYLLHQCKACEKAYYRGSAAGRSSALAWRMRRKCGEHITPAEIRSIPCVDCYLCGQPLGALPKELDHVLPISKGGGAAVGNLRWTHRTCNRMKHDLPLAEFLARCRVILRNLGR